ncbi:uncharacterized protein LOC131934984 [Physella acuta]|uniref:uncharacterized protein LOC131934984 n=1 Tax=Physella acuta TaxID=109671 RepID=UPI0027DDA7B1|nr:uncharacterized protein LOC131934984 [Physella acuta]
MWIARLECVLCCILFAAPVVEPSVWFGPKNEFLCHCEKNHCNIHGECVHGSKCSRGWFGRTCQYFDILGSFNNQHTLTDGDDKTCLGPNSGNVNLTLGATYPFSSIRLVYQDGMTLSKAPDLVLGCATKTYALNNHIWDYFCEDYVTVNHVELKGKTPHNLCSVYFSGGRNMALKQHAIQSSLYRKCFAHNAVNGEKDNCQLDYTHTSTIDSDPYFEVHFKYPSTIHLVKIYNRKSEPNTRTDIGLRLKDFALKIFDSQQTLTHQHQQSAEVQAIYNIEVRNLEHIEKIRIDSLKTQLDFDKVPMISICEIEVYGDCDHGFWDLDCKKCESCSGSCHKETGQCENECSAGYWGLDCQNKCDEDCANPCHRETGRCEKESIGNHTWFGSRKQYQCNCEDDHCHEDGHCRPGVKCYNGWFGKYCQYVNRQNEQNKQEAVGYTAENAGLVVEHSFLDYIVITGNSQIIHAL